VWLGRAWSGCGGGEFGEQGADAAVGLVADRLDLVQGLAGRGRAASSRGTAAGRSGVTSGSAAGTPCWWCLRRRRCRCRCRGRRWRCRNTINKWAAGISDTLALGLLAEGIGLGLPLAALPFLNAAQAAHPAFGRSVKELRDAGVKILLGSEGYEPHVPHQGSKYLAQYPWHVVLGAVETSRT